MMSSFQPEKIDIRVFFAKINMFFSYLFYFIFLFNIIRLYSFSI